MTEFKTVPYRDIFKVLRILNAFNPDNFRFYSRIPRFAAKFILMKNCYYLMDENKLYGLFFIDEVYKEVYFLPIDSKLTFFQLMYFIDKQFRFENYAFNIYYDKLDLIQYRRYFKFFNISINIKTMRLSLTNSNTVYNPHKSSEGLSVRRMKISDEAPLRATLQNSIFGNVLGREDITLKEILEEERSKRFIGDLCFILEKHQSPLGYGQVVYMDNKYQLVNFGILPEKRGKGYGEFFLSHILLECKARGIEELYLTVDNSNTAAVKLYTKVGFIPIINESQIILQ